MSLLSILQPGNRRPHQPRRSALCGLGGSGKTEIAVQFAQDYRPCYSAVFWVNGMDKPHLINGFSLIARHAGVGTMQSLEGNVEAAKNWLTQNDGWLLIVDNVDSDDGLNALHRQFFRVGMKARF